MQKQYAVLAATGLVLAACSDSTTPSGPSRLAPVAEIGSSITSQLVPDEYIVALRGITSSQLSAQAVSIAGTAGAEVIAVYGHAINGFAVKADEAAITAIRANPAVEYVEPAQVYSAIATQAPAPAWGLDRIDQRNFPLSNSFTYPTGGSAVHIYIIDTGLLTTHTDFTGRVGLSSNHITPNGGTPAWTDCNGHGTHVAGTAGGTIYGILKTATIHAVRVLDCGGSGTTTSVVNGINWVIANAVQPAVSNMSIGGGISTTLDNATNNMVAAGVVSAVAAGNNNTNACNGSPARAASALTVGSTGDWPSGTPSDNRSSFSNFGTCLDIFAPGSGIKSDWIGSNTATNTISGTSMASPHVAGSAALYRAFNPTHTATQVANALITNATMNVVVNPGTGSPNRLLYMGFITGGTPNQNPVANFTYVCNLVTATNWRCDLNGSTSTDPDGNVVAWAWSSPGKPNKSGVTSFYNFTAGTHTVNLTVTDNNGGTNTQTQQVVVGAPPANLPPVADFAHNCVVRPDGFGADCTFNGASSTDPDGIIVSYSWTVPGRPTKTGVSVSYPFPRGSTPTITLTVTDDDGATNSKAVQITVP